MEVLEKLEEELEKLKRVPIIIVEGKKDIEALNKLGIYNVVEIKTPLYKLCEQIAKKYDKAAILTDLDKEGKKLYSRLKKNLERNGIKTDDNFRNFLYKETKLSQIEGLSRFL